MQIAHLRLLPLRALHVQHRRLQRAAKGSRLFGLTFLPARQCFDGIFEAVRHVAPKERQVGAARGENALAVGIVGNGI